MIKYLISTPHGMITRTSRNQGPGNRYQFIVVYGGNVGIAGERRAGVPIPTFHGRLDLAQSAAQAQSWIASEIFPITETDFIAK